MQTKLSLIIKKLIEETKINPSRLAKACGIAQPLLHRILSSEIINPSVLTLAPIARFFGITIDQLIGHAPLPPNRIVGCVNSPVTTICYIPLLNWSQIIGWCSYDKSYSIQKLVPTDRTIGNRAYSVISNDNAMSPQFPSGTILIVDPDLKPINGDFVMLLPKKKSIPLFRQYVTDGITTYLKPIDSNFKSYSTTFFTTHLGVVIQAKQDFRDMSSVVSTEQIIIPDHFNC